MSFAHVCDVYDITNKNETFYFILPHPVHVDVFAVTRAGCKPGASDTGE